VTEEEYAKLELTAQAGGKTLGEWCREVIVGQCERAGGEGPAVRWQ